VSKNPKEFELNKQMAELPKSKPFGKLGFFVFTGDELGGIDGPAQSHRSPARTTQAHVLQHFKILSGLLLPGTCNGFGTIHSLLPV